MITLVAKRVHIAATAAVIIAILVIFISPLTDLLPAPQLKHSPAADLLGCIFLLAFALVMQALVSHCIRSDVDPLYQSSDRLEFICLHRC